MFLRATNKQLTPRLTARMALSMQLKKSGALEGLPFDKMTAKIQRRYRGLTRKQKKALEATPELVAEFEKRYAARMLKRLQARVRAENKKKFANRVTKPSAWNKFVQNNMFRVRKLPREERLGVLSQAFKAEQTAQSKGKKFAKSGVVVMDMTPWMMYCKTNAWQVKHVAPKKRLMKLRKLYSRLTIGMMKTLKAETEGKTITAYHRRRVGVKRAPAGQFAEKLKAANLERVSRADAAKFFASKKKETTAAVLAAATPTVAEELTATTETPVSVVVASEEPMAPIVAEVTASAISTAITSSTTTTKVVKVAKKESVVASAKVLEPAVAPAEEIPVSETDGAKPAEQN